MESKSPLTPTSLSASFNASISASPSADAKAYYVELTVADLAILQPAPRLDALLAQRCNLSRSRVQQLISAGHVTYTYADRYADNYAAACADPGAPQQLITEVLKDNDYRITKPGRLEIQEPPAIAAVPVAQDLPLTIVFEDEDLIILNKAAGLVVHPGAGNHDQTLVNALLHHCGEQLSGIGGVKRPGIVHRLDKETSGLMVIAKHDQAHQHLSAQFAVHSLTRRYQGICWQVPLPPQGEINAALARSRHDRQKMAVVSDARGKTAITRYKVIRNFAQHAALMEFTLLTGRTHQIRVHMSHLGHGLVGDPVYGHLPAALPSALKTSVQAWPGYNRRQALHSWYIQLIHPRTQQTIEFTAALPADLQQLLQIFEDYNSKSH